jgi:hypothetical protein
MQRRLDLATAASESPILELIVYTVVRLFFTTPRTSFPRQWTISVVIYIRELLSSEPMNEQDFSEIYFLGRDIYLTNMVQYQLILLFVPHWFHHGNR